LCNCLPSVTQKQHHKALSNGLRCCSSCLELTAALWLAWGFPAEPAAEPFSGPGLQVQGEAPGIDPGNSACWSGVLLLLLAPPTTVICWAFAWPKWWLGSLPNLSVGSVPTNAKCCTIPRVLCGGLQVPPHLEMGWQALPGCLFSTAVPDQISYLQLGQGLLGAVRQDCLWRLCIGFSVSEYKSWGLLLTGRGIQDT
jgi:hypothetical protein